MSADAVAAFLEATVRVATPLALAALGETVTERAGVINVGLEGSMLGGALAAALVAAGTGAPWLGVVAGAGAGALLAAVLVVVAIGLRGDQIVTGTAVTLGAIGLTGALYRSAFGAGGAALSLPTFAPVTVPGLIHLPLAGSALFAQPAPTYLVYAAVPVLWVLFRHTQLGLALRAAGEAPQAATAAGLRVRSLRAGATLFGGAMAGMAGAALVLAQAGTFAERMTAGRGFIAIAIVVLGRWHPVGVAAAALLFGAASALQYTIQATGATVPYQLLLMLPYVITLLALGGVGGRARAPEALGRS
jgi:simple sugar transport system permease protein